MTPKDLITIQLAFRYGATGKWVLKKIVNEALEVGEWHDEFDLAVGPDDLGDEEARTLMASVLAAYPAYILDLERLAAIIAKYLPQAGPDTVPVSWLVGPDSGILLTDSLRVAKVKNDLLCWATKRISWDGIEFDRVENNVVFGKWYDVTYDEHEWQPLELCYRDGSLLKGSVIEF